MGLAGRKNGGDSAPQECIFLQQEPKVIQSRIPQKSDKMARISPKPSTFSNFWNQWNSEFPGLKNLLHYCWKCNSWCHVRYVPSKIWSEGKGKDSKGTDLFCSGCFASLSAFTKVSDWQTKLLVATTKNGISHLQKICKRYSFSPHNEVWQVWDFKKCRHFISSSNINETLSLFKGKQLNTR